MTKFSKMFSTLVVLGLSWQANASPGASMNCSDISEARETVEEKIVDLIKAAHAKGLKPAVPYDDQMVFDRMRAADAIDVSANHFAKKVSDGLFAAVESSRRSNIAAAAATEILGAQSRRGTLDLFARCANYNGLPKQVVSNNAYDPNHTSCPGNGYHKDIGVRVLQIFQTNVPALKAVSQFVQSKLQSNSDNTVSICRSDLATCKSGQGFTPISEHAAANMKLNFRTDYVLQDSTSFSTFMAPMVNRYVMNIQPLDLCGSRIYLLTGFGLSQSLGFDRYTLIGLVAPVGGKTLVIGDFAGQSLNDGRDNKWPLWFPSKANDLQTKIFQGYAEIAEIVGSQERPVMGELGGRKGTAVADLNPAGGRSMATSAPRRRSSED
jgi:hypothetical protein